MPVTLIESENTAICGSDMVRARRAWIEARKRARAAMEALNWQDDLSDDESDRLEKNYFDAADAEGAAYLTLIRANDAFDASLGLKR